MEHRHQKILTLLHKRKQIKVQELSTILNTSAVTIRKDLKLLEEKRLLFRTHGGASLESPYVNDRSVNEKEFINAKEKALIGLQASKIITADQYIILASGNILMISFI